MLNLNAVSNGLLPLVGFVVAEPGNGGAEQVY